MSQFQPRTFDQLNNLIVTESLIQGRSYANDTLYQNYIKHVPDDLKNAILDAQIAQQGLQYNNHKTGFIPNSLNIEFSSDYDYILQYLPHVKHYLLFHPKWGTPRQELEIIIQKWIKAIWKKDLDFCFFVDQPKNRSLKNRPHAHVFIDFSNF